MLPTSRVIDSAPAAVPTGCAGGCQAESTEMPADTGTRPRRSGKAKVVRPSPPYWTPSRANRAWLVWTGINWPSHKAKPLGAKGKPAMMIWPR
ncbi:hypothetical protein G6F59_018315 [Rhizopus arrhizus]|nr:hypothetical protein G6F59_018315 [Rhizopus arrhizus]